jgi:MFS family permease
MNTILTSDTSAVVSSEKSGQVFGVLEAAQNVCGMVGPILGGLLTKYLSPVDTPHFAALCSVLVLYGLAFVFIFFGYDAWVLGIAKANLSHPNTSFYKYKDRNL